MADQSQTENMAGTEYLKALQTESACVHVCGDRTVHHVCVYRAGCAGASHEDVFKRYC